jgi:hypothetical protein
MLVDARDKNFSAIDPRLHELPDRMEVIDAMSGHRRSLSSMQLWEVEDGPVVIEPNGESRIFLRGEWRGMDSWEAVFEGRPLSFQMFEKKWPGLVSVDKYLASFHCESR